MFERFEQGGHARIALRLPPNNSEGKDDEPSQENADEQEDAEEPQTRQFRQPIPRASHSWTHAQMQKHEQTVLFEGTGSANDSRYLGSNCVFLQGDLSTMKCNVSAMHIGPNLGPPFSRLVGEFSRCPQLAGNRAVYLGSDHKTALW